MTYFPRLARVALATGIAATAVAGVAAGAAAAPDPGTLRPGLQRLVADQGFPAALGTELDPDGSVHQYAAGVRDRRTGAPAVPGEAVRIGSNTKTFTSVVVLQLVGDGRVRLDAPVETYLPGVLRGRGIDGRRITVRQLLQHTSGLPNYTDVLGEPGAMLRNLHVYAEPDQLLDRALALPPTFPPGTGWSYSNTNFVVLGLIAQRVTGRPLAELVTDRIVRPLGLRDTGFPVGGDQGFPGPHPHGYFAEKPGQRLTDVTVQDPAFAWAAGAMISTPADLDRFLAGLLRGELLAPRQLAEMKRTVPAEGLGEGARYGLGLISVPLPCGGVAWGHGGSIAGYATADYATDDGHAVTVATTRLPFDLAEFTATEDVVKAALCD